MKQANPSELLPENKKIIISAFYDEVFERTTVKDGVYPLID